MDSWKERGERCRPRSRALLRMQSVWWPPWQRRTICPRISKSCGGCSTRFWPPPAYPPTPLLPPHTPYTGEGENLLFRAFLPSPLGEGPGARVFAEGRRADGGTESRV